MRLINTKILITGALSLLCLSGYAQNVEEADSLAFSRDLEEIVVEGRTQKTIRNGVEYIPGKKMKKASYDATSLLFNMQIPQLNVMPGEEIKTIANQSVSIFIDYIPASSDDTGSLNPEDVLRVEVLDHPSDPRFRGADYVVNFIMKHYEWGGYTKLQGGWTFLNGNIISGNIYEKFSYKNWTFDVNASAFGVWNYKGIKQTRETFRDFMYGSEKIGELEKFTDTDYSHLRTNSESATARAVYSRNNTYLSHTFSFMRTGTPISHNAGSVTFSDDLLPSTDFSNRITGNKTAYNLGGYYMFGMKKGNYVFVDWSFTHSNTDNESLYRLGDLAPIENGSHDRTETIDVSTGYSQPLGHNNILSGWVSNYSNFYNTRYSGSSDAYDRMISSHSMLFLDYSQYFPCGISLFTRVGAAYVLGRLNGETFMSNWNPRAVVNLQYRINSHHNVSLVGSWANSQPEATVANDATVRQDELLWIKGNTDLKNIYGPTVNASYSFIPSNRLSFAASSGYMLVKHTPVYDYLTMDGYEGIIRTYSDDNTTRQLRGDVSATGKFLNNSLVVQLGGGVRREILSGCHPMNLTDWTGKVSATYFVGPLSFNVMYTSPSKSITTNTGWLRKTPHGFHLFATYNAGNLNVNFEFHNWFGKGKLYTSYDSGHYSSTGWAWLNGLARNMRLALTYTLPYGKKVDRSEDLTNKAEVKSAIIE